MKFFKRLFWLTLLGVVSWWGWKTYERVRALYRLSNSLPLFLKNTVGDKPSLNLNMLFNSFDATLRFDQATLDREDNLEQMVREYVEDFYPYLAGMNMRIKIEARSSSNVVEPAPVEPVEAVVEADDAPAETETDE